MKVDLRGPKTLGEIIRFAYRAYAKQFAPFFLIALATVPLQMLSAVVTDRVESEDTANLIMLPLQVANTLVFLVVTGALIHGANLVASGTPVEAGASLDAAFARFGDVLTTQLLFAVLTVASIVAFPYTGYRYLKDVQNNEPRGVLTVVGVIVGAVLYFWVRWTFSLQAVMLENKRNWAALDSSASIVETRWWRTLGVILGIVVVAVLPASIVAASAAYAPVLVAAVVASGVLAIVLPFVIIAQTLLYFDLKARKETDVSPV